MGSNGVEIPKRYGVPPLRKSQILKKTFVYELRTSVGVRRRKPGGFSKREWIVRLVDGGARREDDVPDSGIFHFLKQYERPPDVDVVVFEGDFDALPHRLEPREMDDGFDFIVTQGLADGVPVADVSLDECRTLSEDFFEPVEHRNARVAQVIEKDRRDSGPLESHARMRADIAESASEEYGCGCGHGIYRMELLRILSKAGRFQNFTVTRRGVSFSIG